MTLPLAVRFWLQVNKNGPVHPVLNSPCWLWTGALAGRDKRGRITTEDGRRVYAARAAWFLQYGEWPKNQVCHRCDNTACVRWDHLFDGTQVHNMQDAAYKGRTTRGEKDAMAKLTLEQVQEIRARYIPRKNGGIYTLAKEFGVAPQTISDVIRRKRWGWA